MIIHPMYGPQFDYTDGTVGKVKLVKRWVLVKGNGRLFHPLQGRYTKATKAEAEEACRAFLEAQPPGHSNHHFVEGLHVGEWWCYPGHFDPCGSVEKWDTDAMVRQLLKEQEAEEKLKKEKCDGHQ